MASSGSLPAKLGSLRLQGIVWGARFPQAIINGEVLKIGDSLDGIRIVDIDKHGVRLFLDGKNYILSLTSSVTEVDPLSDSGEAKLSELLGKQDSCYKELNEAMQEKIKEMGSLSVLE